MTGLIDLDSILYKAVYRIVSIKEMRDAIIRLGKDGARQWVNEEVYNEGINRCENELLKMQNYVQDVFLEEITSFEIFITTCSKNFRKDIAIDYKANRKRNKYVWMLREHYRFNDGICSDIYEADDLIYDRAKELGKDNCVIITMDKDLKQIGGYYWSYYKHKSRDVNGDTILNEFGIEETEYKQKNVEYITDSQADRFFWSQVLSGDTSDNIKGITAITKEQKQEVKKEWGANVYCRVGESYANKILESSVNHFITVARQYVLRGQKNEFWVNYRLLKLGTNREVEKLIKTKL